MDEPSAQELLIDDLGPRGEGLARVGRGAVAIFGALPGERVLARIEGGRGRLVAVLSPSPDRVAPICPYFGDCGGCATQHCAPALAAGWKRRLLADALAAGRVAAPLGPLIDAHGEGRRRATFHARFAQGGASVEVGFMRARAHEIVEIETCPVLAPGMAGALGAARALAKSLRGVGKPLDITVTATLTGLDVDVRGCGALDFAPRQALIATANRFDLARLSNHGETVIERRAPEVMIGAARVRPPAGGFLQATVAGERALAELALSAAQGARRVADLFCGVGAFALRLAAEHEVHAVEIDRAALAALARAAGETRTLRSVACEARDLFRRPLRREELASFDAVVFDPPRAGAPAQSRELAASAVPTVVAISCDAASFARDVGILAAGGYRIESIAPIDQFRFSPHIEIVGVLRKPKAGGSGGRARSKGPSGKGLLG
ncbi:MAG: class I SAM-dependent RNA methyltransferase [Roseiarcus sp.]